MNQETDDGKDPVDELEYDKNKYVSHAEYMRDVNALKKKEIKFIVFLVSGLLLGFINIYLIRFMESDHQFDWIIGDFAFDQIMAYIAVIFILLIPGIWVGIAKHKIYSIIYFSGCILAADAESRARLTSSSKVLRSIAIFWKNRR